MGRALLYYELLSRWNRLRSRLQRLRQPKYLFGAVVGGLYFYWYFFRVLMRPGQGGRARRRWLPGTPRPGGIAGGAGSAGHCSSDVDHSPRARRPHVHGGGGGLSFPGAGGTAHPDSFQTAQIPERDFVQRAFYDADRAVGRRTLFVPGHRLVGAAFHHQSPFAGKFLRAHPAAGARHFQLAAAAVCPGRRGIGGRRSHPVGAPGAAAAA